MARTLNKVQLIGRLGADPEMRITSSGMPVTTFSVATNRQWQGKDGTMQEETDWHTIVAWDKLGQLCNDYLSKGRLVYIEGRLRTRSWDNNGQKMYRTEVVASDMLILDSRQENGEVRSPAAEPEVIPPRQQKSPSRSATPAAAPARQANGRAALVMDEDGGDDPEDLPF